MPENLRAANIVRNALSLLRKAKTLKPAICPAKLPSSPLKILCSTIEESPSYTNINPQILASSAATEALPLDIDRYHVLSDQYIDTLVAQLEEIQEEREDVDVEYSAGVLTLVFPPHGTYVINKQPPNRQIWLSSPISGPKRFDWVKLDTGSSWVYLKDGSTLTGLLQEEIGVKC